MTDTPQARTIMLQGTASDVGKSLLTAALCRILTEDGWRTAPFKSQNMSLNSYVTWDGKEIGRAQGMQADACGILATTDMNPILLKPKGEMLSQVIVHGRPLRDYEARAYREELLPLAERIVREALERLRAHTDAVVLEGAGSPAEINLKDRDIVNMRMAEWAEAPVLLVADIDRGGVFAAIVGTLELLEPHERNRVAGVIINKFRGDVSLLRPGLDWLEQRTGKPVLGVVPYLPGLELESEDSLSLDNIRPAAVDNLQTGRLDIAVIRLPRLSNFTDLDPLAAEPDVHLRYVDSARALGSPDAVIVPGSKNTMADLAVLRSSGMAEGLLSYADQGGRVVGVCGGYEMMGRMLLDPERTESELSELPGLGWFPFDVVFAADKRTVRVSGHGSLPGMEGSYPVEGYEIHTGLIAMPASVQQPFCIQSAVHAPETSAPPVPEGAASPDGRIWGTFIHGILHNDGFRRAWLDQLRKDRGWPPGEAGFPYHERRQDSFARLAEHVRAHVDIEAVYKLMGLEARESERR
ncbi:cobyric acid synthase [Paenibacillus sp. 1P07SE]|uniref:cobyric acid synthase n=1 Tax=Paenibacillus sp. 1P07SE TaxID=3132209 RepID=UPI0039A73808